MDINMIYVVCPAKHKTGGTELAHQLVSLYTALGLPVIVAYTNVNKGEDPVNQAFKCYVNSWIDVNDVHDAYGNVIFLPEIQVDLIPRFSKSTVVYWWMSVDFFIDICGFAGTVRHFGFLRALNRLRLTKKYKDKTPLARKADLHAYQSEYARQYIEKEKYGIALPLSDYINDVYLEKDFEIDNREDIVLYNPKKGYRYTKKLIKAFPKFKWVALEKMTTEEVKAVMNKSKVYIDFGNHPGKDRFPREAAISGCCIVTGVRGAAANTVDIPIPPCFKFKETHKNIKLIGSTIQDCLNNYPVTVNEYSSYREKIKLEKCLFKEQAICLINKIKEMPSKEKKL